MALILAHVEACGGREAVDAVLARTGLSDREAALRDERSWWSWETKIALFEAAGEVLGDPDVTYTAGRSAIERGVAAPLKTALRALGSPSLVYSNIVRANHKFSTVTRMVLEDMRGHRARLRYEHLSDKQPHRLDCLYNQGLLSCVPALFGLPPARIEHPICAMNGGEDCVYDVTWQPQLRPGWRKMAGWGAGAAALVAGTGAIAPDLTIFAVTAAASALAWRTSRGRAQLVQSVGDLERELELRTERTERVRKSLRALSAALARDEVVSAVTEHTGHALGGLECVLMLAEQDGLRAQPAPWLGDEQLAALERWAAGGQAAQDILNVDDTSLIPGLAQLQHGVPPVGSLCAAPLIAHGESLGLLIACAQRAHSFLPADIALLDLFADQSAIALFNAGLYAAQQEMATRDPLTGLGNHRDFHDTVDRELARCRRTGARFAVGLLDLDGFKAVNDTWGHAAGDELLRKVGDALERAARGADVAFRVGGDEFAVLLPECGFEAAQRATERIAHAAAAVDNRIGVSWGVGAWPEEGPDKEALLARADERLYAMKRKRGRGVDAVAELIEALGSGRAELDSETLSALERLAARLRHQ